MEINITEFFYNECPRDYSASVAELGRDAGKLTWDYSNEYVEENPPPMINSPEQIDNFKDYIETFGAWERDEIEAWTNTELNALFIQLISGDMREYQDDVETWDWEEYEKLCEAGQCSSCIFKGTDNQIYYYVGS
jgi:hypothetical protein